MGGRLPGDVGRFRRDLPARWTCHRDRRIPAGVRDRCPPWGVRGCGALIHGLFWLKRGRPIRDLPPNPIANMPPTHQPYPPLVENPARGGRMGPRDSWTGWSDDEEGAREWGRERVPLEY